MNEGSSSRLYSFNIYVNSDIVYYNRNYKNIFLIISDGFPTVNIIFIFFRLIAKLFKISSGNQKLIELLFENQNERTNILKNKKANTLKLDNDKTNKTKYSNKKLKTSQIDINKNSKINETSSFLHLNLGYNEGQKLFKNIFVKSKNTFLREKFRNSFNPNHFRLIQENLEHIKNNDYNINNSKNNIFNNIIKIKSSNKKEHYIKNKLFPYKYYFCSIFIKNIDISKKSIFFTKKFVATYIFICQLLDISSYLIFQREFQNLKNTLIIRKYKEFIESNKKINVDDQLFINNMKECLDSHKFSIFCKLNNSQEINQ